MKIFTYDESQQIGQKAAIGLIVLSTDETLEYELRHWLGIAGVTIYVSRVPMATTNTPEALRAMEAHIEEAARLLPQRVDYQVIAYGCTSASAVIGHEATEALLAKGCEARAYTNPLKALEAYCIEEGVTNIDLLTPYGAATSNSMIKAIEKAGITIQNKGSFNEMDDQQVARIAPSSTKEAAIALSKTSDAPALFLSCTNLRSYDILEPLTKELGKLVISSNSVLAWHIAKLCNL